MIKINLIAEKKATKSRAAAAPGVTTASSQSGGQTLVLVALLAVGVAISGVWWWNLADEKSDLQVEIDRANVELERLKEIRAKGDAYKAKKELLARKIELITELKKRQSVPVHILDQVSKNLPELLWLESMTASQNQINLGGKATNYNAVSRFYRNLQDSGHFVNVTLGRTYEVREGVAFSLTCRFGGVEGEEGEAQDQQG
ncbi:MAG: PilN domain-containing protein [bacterium]|nr:PilN domain-containing protein [bacterium]